MGSSTGCVNSSLLCLKRGCFLFVGGPFTFFAFYVRGASPSRVPTSTFLPKVGSHQCCSYLDFAASQGNGESDYTSRTHSWGVLALVGVS